jgi:hypothetical protein
VKLTARWLAVVLLLWLSIEPAPAPIIETPASPAPARPKAKSPSVRSEAQATTASKFVGTWTTTVTTRSEKTIITRQVTMVIQEKSASLTEIVTNALATADGSWNNIPEPYNTVSPFDIKYLWSTTDLSIDGANLRVRWPAGQMMDWNPKTLPFTVIQPLAVAPPAASVFTLHGDQLTRELDRPGCPTFYRVRGSRK